jgi:hypothetical protein
MSGISSNAMRCLLSLAAVPLFSLHCVAALAGDISRDTPAASMALAQGLYATPAPSATVSVVATPTVTASALPSESPPDRVTVAAPPPVETPPPLKASRTDWTSYVAIVTGIVGAIAGIAGAIMGALGLRRANRQRRRY